MDASEIIEFIAAPGDVKSVEAEGNYFFTRAQEKAAKSAHWMPFATLITNDAYDQHSDLNRQGVYRLNIGVSRATFQQLFEQGEQTAAGST